MVTTFRWQVLALTLITVTCLAPRLASAERRSISRRTDSTTVRGKPSRASDRETRIQRPTQSASTLAGKHGAPSLSERLTRAARRRGGDVLFGAVLTSPMWGAALLGYHVGGTWKHALLGGMLGFIPNAPFLAAASQM